MATFNLVVTYPDGQGARIMAALKTHWTTTDEQGQQDLLLELLEPAGATSVRAALHDSDNLGGPVDGLHCDRPTGYRLYDEIGAQAPLIGVEWRVRVYTTSGGPS